MEKLSPGANQLLWYYADLEKQRCYREQRGEPEPELLLPGNVTYGPELAGFAPLIRHDINHCLAWRRFAK